MKNKERPFTSAVSPKASDGVGKPDAMKTTQGAPHAAQDDGQKVDRPGFDLSGSIDETHAGTGLGLGENASETAGDRRLPGRRLDGKLTIPRWSGPGLHGPAASAAKTEDAATPPPPKTKSH